jgi:hypothetical protein
LSTAPPGLPGYLVALVRQGLADGGGGDGGLVVGDLDPAGVDVDGRGADAGEAAQGGLDGAAAVVAGAAPGRRGDRARAAARATTARAARARRRRRVAAGRAGLNDRSCSEQATTNTLDRLMAAAATIGWSRPVAARGMAATL